MSILDIFYNEVIPEAATGRVEGYLMFNIAFNTILENKALTSQVIKQDRLLFPTLIIKNKEEFDKMLILYVSTAVRFYDGNFYGEKYETAMKEYIKSTLALLWSNATSEDFVNPVEFLRNRINFLNDETLTPKTIVEPKETSIGVLTTEIKKDQIFNETPYYMEFAINGNPLPVVRFGISDGTCYIYAIQNITKLTRDKRLNRALYGVNKGLDTANEPNDNISNPENLVGITPSTLAAATLAISLLKANGIDNIVIPALLPTRWNAKEIAYNVKGDYLLARGEDDEDVEEFIEKSHNDHDEIQRNLSDKFIRTFRRLEYHFDNIEVTALPFIEDINMHLKVTDVVECNNPLLKELYISLQNNNFKL